MTNLQFTDCSPIFVVGASRSGTTLLQLLLNAHPNITVSGELHYFDTILQLKKMVPTIESDADLKDFFVHLPRVSGFQYLPRIDDVLEKVQERLRHEDSRSYEKFYYFLLKEYALLEKPTSRFGEKTPENIRYLEQIIEIFPNARIIHIVRDPRDVVSSMLKVAWTANDVVMNTLKWKCDMFCGIEFSLKHPSAYLEIRYEDLVLKSEAQLTSVCTFLNEPYDRRMLEFHTDSRAHIKDEPWKEGTFNSVNPTSIGKWKTDLSAARVHIIESVAGNLFSRFGYEKAKTSFTARLVFPVVFISELLNYCAYKFQDRQERKKTENAKLIFGESEKLHSLFLRVVSGWHPKE